MVSNTVFIARMKGVVTYMNYIITGKNIEVTEALRDIVVKKMSRLEKFFSPATEAHITFNVEKNRHILEVTIMERGMVFRAEETNEDMYASIDRAVDIIERQLRKHKTRLEKRFRTDSFEADSRVFIPIEDEMMDEEPEFKVVRSKRFAIKPMDTEEAILQMNLLGHNFFMFSNAESGQVNVVYKRKDGNYGVIEPEED